MKEGAEMIKSMITAALSVKVDTFKNKLMNDTEFDAEYNVLAPRYELISQTIETRKNQKTTQEVCELKI